MANNSNDHKTKSKNKTTTRIPVDEYEALQHMKGPELRTLVRSARTDGSFVSVTAMSTAHLNEINKLMSQMRSEEMSLDWVEMDRIVKMGISLNAVDDVEAFIKPRPDKQTVVIYALDYTNLNRAIHYIKVKIQRLQTTEDARRKGNLKKAASAEANVNRSFDSSVEDDVNKRSNPSVEANVKISSENKKEMTKKPGLVRRLSCGSKRSRKIKTTTRIPVDEYEALQHMKGPELRTLVRSARTDGSYVCVTAMSAADLNEINKLMSQMRSEEMSLDWVEMDRIVKLGISLNAVDDVEAFIKPLPDKQTVVIYAFDYTNLNRAMHYIKVRIQRLQTTPEAKRKEKRIAAGGADINRSSENKSAKSSLLVTKNDIQVSVYKANITQLTVDAIINAANEHLAHGGGVAFAISKAAGHVLEIEGDEYIKTHGNLKVTDVVPTSSGNLPCKKVLHAVGPRWKDYQDKNLCQQHLEQTVFNCFLLAHKHHVISLAMSSISSAIFGVPKHTCATMYLAAIQRFDYEYGPITTLRHIHFVDISDEMVAIIHETFSKKWNTIVKPPKCQKSRTDTNGSEWDSDKIAPCSTPEITEKWSQLHSSPRRVRRDKTHDSWYDVEPVETLNKNYFPLQSDTHQFYGASPREKGTTQYGSKYPDRHTSTKMLPGGLSNNSSANDKPLRENDHTYGPIRSRSGQIRELDDRNETTSSYVSNNDGNETERYNSANAQSYNQVPGIRELYNSTNVQSSSYMHDGNRGHNSATNDTHDTNGKYNSATNNTHDRSGRYNSATNDTHDRSGRYNSATNDTHDRNGKYNSATNDAHDRSGRYNSATNDTHDRNGRYNSATNDTHDTYGKYNSATNDRHDRNGRYNSATNDAHYRNGGYNSATNCPHDRNGKSNSTSV